MKNQNFKASMLKFYMFWSVESFKLQCVKHCNYGFIYLLMLLMILMIIHAIFHSGKCVLSSCNTILYCKYEHIGVLNSYIWLYICLYNILNQYTRLIQHSNYDNIAKSWKNKKKNGQIFEYNFPQYSLLESTSTYKETVR